MCDRGYVVPFLAEPESETIPNVLVEEKLHADRGAALVRGIGARQLFDEVVGVFQAGPDILNRQAGIIEE